MSVVKNALCGFLLADWFCCVPFPGSLAAPCNLSDDVQYHLSCKDGQQSTGVCSQLRISLQMVRQNFTTGVEVAGRRVVLDPLHLEDFHDADSTVTSRWRVKEVVVSGLKGFHLEEILLGSSHMQLKVSFPRLEGTVSLKSTNSFIPISPQFNLLLLNIHVGVSTGWSLSGSAEGLVLADVDVDLNVDSFHAEITNFLSLGTGLERTLNKHNDEIIKFLIPSLEAALVRQIYRLQQEYQTGSVHLNQLLAPLSGNRLSD